MTISFADAEVPQSASAPKENPYLPLVQEMIKSKRAKVVTLPCATSEDEKALNSLVQTMQAAGRIADVTVRKVIDKNKGKATVTFWTVDKIVRTRKNQTETAENQTETAE